MRAVRQKLTLDRPATCEIKVPVLIVNAVDGTLTLHVNAKAMAERIPGAQRVMIEGGGHILLGHEERIRSEVVTFLAGILHDKGGTGEASLHGPERARGRQPWAIQVLPLLRNRTGTER